MVLTRLSQRRVEKPWGRCDLPTPFEPVTPGGEAVGEILFEHPAYPHPELLIKFLFTSEKLSVQVHPDNAAARERGFPHGKDEAWYILEAEKDATIGIGLKQSMSIDAVRRAALDGSLENAVDWRPVAAGEILYAPAGTIHAIGSGVALVEVQQNLDLTYRLFDYGRDRPLQLDEALAVASPRPWVPNEAPRELDEQRTLLCAEREFRLERWTAPLAREIGKDGTRLWLVALGEGVEIDGETLPPANVAIVEGPATIALSGDASALVATTGKVIPSII